MKHTYLFEEGVWNASGIYVDESGREFPVEGRANISHGVKTWKLSGGMRMLTDSPIELQNTYEIESFEAGQDCTKWSSHNSDIGELTGKFIVVHDSILSIYGTKNNEYEGTEYLKQINENTYQNCGALMKNDVRISSWAVELKR